MMIVTRKTFKRLFGISFHTALERARPQRPPERGPGAPGRSEGDLMAELLNWPAWAHDLLGCDTLHHAIKYLVDEYKFSETPEQAKANLQARGILLDLQIAIYREAERELIRAKKWKIQ